MLPVAEHWRFLNGLISTQSFNKTGVMMKVVAFVPIKLNSQRLPQKNILPLGKHALCWYIFDSLGKVKQIDDIYVFCSDESIKEYIPDNVKFLKRDPRLDGDTVKGAEIYSDFIKTVDADVYVLAHATSPFIASESLDNAVSKVLSGENDSAFSAQRIQTFAWYKGKPINYELTDVPRTQDLEPVWIETSAFFVFKKEVFTEMGRRIGEFPYVQEVCGRETIDIDTNDDYELACRYIAKED